MNLTGMPPAQAAGLWTGLLLILMIVLMVRVVMNRRLHKVLFGDGGIQPVVLATRAFGNAAEYVPLAIGAMILMALVGASAFEIHLVGATFLLGRLFHGFGLSFGKGPGPGRLIGMSLTILALAFAAVLLLIAAAIA